MFEAVHIQKTVSGNYIINYAELLELKGNYIINKILAKPFRHKGSILRWIDQLVSVICKFDLTFQYFNAYYQ